MSTTIPLHVGASTGWWFTTMQRLRDTHQITPGISRDGMPHEKSSLVVPPNFCERSRLILAGSATLVLMHCYPSSVRQANELAYRGCACACAGTTVIPFTTRPQYDTSRTLRANSLVNRHEASITTDMTARTQRNGMPSCSCRSGLSFVFGEIQDVLLC